MKISLPTTKLLALLLLALVSISGVSANLSITTYEHDTTFNSAFQETRACSCGTTTDYFTLENRGDFTATYVLTLQSAVDWIELHQQRITLLAGETTIIPVTLSPPCGEEDVTTYQIFATSEYGRYRVADRTVTAQTCENIGLRVEPQDQQTLPCTDANYDVTLRNTGTFDERYTLSASDDAVDFATRTLRLAPGDTAHVQAKAQWSCDTFGTKEVTFFADAEKNSLRMSAPTKVEILWDYDFVLDLADSNKNICAEEDNVFAIQVHNAASTQNTYELTTNSAFATLSRETLTVAPQKTETVLVTVHANEQQLGSQNVIVNAKTTVGNAHQQITLPLTIRDCYEHEVLVTPQRSWICAGEGNYTVQVQNRGENTENFAMYTTGDIFSEVIPEKTTLRAGEHSNSILHLVIPDRDEHYSVQVHTIQTPGSETVTPVEFDAISNARCTLPDVGETDLEVYTDTNGVPIILENKGYEATTYTLGWEGKIFTLQETEVFLAPGEQAILHIIPRENVTLTEGDYVERFVLTSDRSEYRHDFSFDVNERGWISSAWNAIFGPQGIAWCELLILVLSIIAIVLVVCLLLTYVGIKDAKKTTAEDKKTKSYVLGVFALLFVLLAVAAGIYAQPTIQVIDEPQGTNISGLYHETLMNEEYTLDLSQYFADPDEDTLSYTSSQPEHLSVRVSGDTAFIKPESNWAGQDYVVFTAIDSNGLAADSPIMTVRVLATRKGTFGAFVSAYCWMINALLAALICVLLLAGVYTEPDKELKKRYGEPIREVLTPTPIAPYELQPVPPPPTQTQVQGDVVAGDKVTIVGKQKDNIFIASSSGKKVHLPTCQLAQRTPKAKRVVVEGKAEALRQGYTPCKMCRPFE